MGHVRFTALSVSPRLILDCSLVYPDDIKPRLLNYIYATLVLSDAQVDCEYIYLPHSVLSNQNHVVNIVSWNR